MRANVLLTRCSTRPPPGNSLFLDCSLAGVSFSDCNLRTCRFTDTAMREVRIVDGQDADNCAPGMVR
jgi:uncharacterized protein YjbI with pentapeptide repeats